MVTASALVTELERLDATDDCWPCRPISIDDFDSDLEQSDFLMGALLVRGIIPAVAAADIANQVIRLIFEAALELDHDGDVINAATLVGKLRDWDLLPSLRSLGGIDFIVALVEHRPLLASVPYHVARIKAAAHRRRIAALALELHLAARDIGDIGEALDALREAT